MRDDLPPRPTFRLDADDDRPLQLRAAHYDPVQPPERVSPWRVALIGGVAAAGLGVAVAFAVPGGRAPKAAEEAHPDPAFHAISARYAPPDRGRIADAHAEVDRLVAQEGLAAAARASMSCFERLGRAPDYGLMDYCLALDAYGAAAYAKAAGEAAPASTYFGQGSVRRQKAVQMLTAGQTDANSRLIDTNRLIEQVALQAAIPEAPVPAVAVVTTAPAADVPPPAPAPAVPAPKATVKVFRPAPPVVAEAPAEPAVKVIRVQASPQPSPKTSPKPPPKSVKTAPAKAAAKPAKAAKAQPVKAPAKPVPAKAKPARPLLAKAAPARPRAAPAAPAPKVKAPPAAPDSGPWMNKLEAVLKRPADPAPQPAPARPKPAPGPEAKAAAPPAAVTPRAAERPAALDRASTETVRPSFDCRSAMSRGQRLVCREPSLAAADRRLSAAFNQALRDTDNPRSLIAEQNRWLALRDQLAPNVVAVMDLYQDRIAELRRLAY